MLRGEPEITAGMSAARANTLMAPAIMGMLTLVISYSRDSTKRSQKIAMGMPMASPISTWQHGSAHRLRLFRYMPRGSAM